jgi:tetratricopeptide (TPR) repeat protein
MSDASTDEIERLLRDGLNRYGMGEIAQAIRAWRQVLKLDPGNLQAREYLDSVADEAADVERPAGAERGGTPDLLETALECLRDDDPEGALELLENVAARDPDALEVQGYIEMVRSRLLKRYREQFGSGSATPTLRLEADALLKFNLPSEAGFLLSMIDGRTTVQDLVSVCGMDEFRALRILAHMQAAGIVEISS